MAKLDKEEKELLKSYEDGEWKSVSNKKREVGRLQDYATATFKKDRRINIRISSKDLNSLQKRALEEGIPYQTLVSSILHKYVSGRLREESAYHLVPADPHPFRVRSAEPRPLGSCVLTSKRYDAITSI